MKTPLSLHAPSPSQLVSAWTSFLGTVLSMSRKSERERERESERERERASESHIVCSGAGLGNNAPVSLTVCLKFTNVNSILLHIIDVRAPWQNGRTERHGDIYKKIFDRARWLHSRSSSVALQRLAMECNAAKNRLSNRSSGLDTVFLRA